MTDTAISLHISASAHHRIHTATVRMDAVGWVLSGRKQLLAPAGGHAFATGQFFVLPRGAQWDVVNDPAPQGRYVARMLCFTPETVTRFHQQFGAFAALAPVQGCARLSAGEAFQQSFMRAVEAVEDVHASDGVRMLRALEVLLRMAEQGRVFALPGSWSWSERVYRLVSQRPQAAWTLQDVAASFGLSASTLQRRLAQEQTHLSECLQTVRLENALTLLQTTSLPVAEVAERCGYASHSRFSATFRQRFGFAPSQLRD